VTKTCIHFFSSSETKLRAVLSKLSGAIEASTCNSHMFTLTLNLCRVQSPEWPPVVLSVSSVQV
jgi:hypothetical protein